MILFYSIAAGLIAVALLFLLPPLLRKRSTPPEARIAANATIYREQLEELAAELQRGSLTKEEFERGSREIEHRIVSEYGMPGAPQPPGWRPNTAAALAIGLLLPVAVVFGHWQLGEPRALVAASAQQVDMKQLPALIERLATHLKQVPQDAEGWTLLARAQAALGHYEPAAQAYARALHLLPEDRDLLLEFVKSLAMAGRAEFDAKNFSGAIAYWERILPFAPPESEFARTVAESIADARQQSGSVSVSLQGVVKLDPALKGKVSPGDTVFIFARPTDGSKMPLAVARTTVGKLPYAFTLDDSMAMAPNAKLSGHARVFVAARISKSGNAAPQKGDMEGLSAPVAPGAAGIQVVISRTLD